MEDGVHNYQCCRCGKIHTIDKQRAGKIKEDLYYNAYCEKCRSVTLHLDVGSNIDEQYELMDSFLDSRYFDYRKTIHND